MIRSALWKVSLVATFFVIGGLAVEAADLSVTTVNGVTTVVYNGEQVFMGSTSGTVSSRAGSYDGVELAAAYDGENVIWENVAGAGKFLREAERGR